MPSSSLVEVEVEVGVEVRVEIEVGVDVGVKVEVRSKLYQQVFYFCGRVGGWGWGSGVVWRNGD